MDPFVIPRVSLPSQNLEKFWKTVPWVSLCHCLQRDNNGFITRGIGVEYTGTTGDRGKVECHVKLLQCLFVKKMTRRG